MAAAQLSNCFVYTPTRDVLALHSARISSTAMVPKRDFSRIRTAFTTGTPLLVPRASYPSIARKGTTIKCEQSTKGGSGLDVWLGRLAMMGFAAAISVEIATGKGLLKNFGIMSPVPAAALVVTGLVGVLTAVFIFQSAEKN